MSDQTSPAPSGSTHDDYTEVRVRNEDRCLIVSERGSDELTVMAQCYAALSTLDAEGAAAVSEFVAARHRLVNR